jgi:hypothetical protein
MWQEYQSAWTEYRRAESRLRCLADQREELEVSLGPSAIRYDKDIVQTSREDHTTAVLAKLADIDLLIAQARETVMIRDDILKRERTILETSTDIHDRIYFLYFVRHLGVRRISREVAYSRSQIFKTLKKMRLNETLNVVQ